jgi:hypothetical protein
MIAFKLQFPASYFHEGLQSMMVSEDANHGELEDNRHGTDLCTNDIPHSGRAPCV